MPRRAGTDEPASCTDLTWPEIVEALAAARPGRAPERRDLLGHVDVELTDGTIETPDRACSPRLTRGLNG